MASLEQVNNPRISLTSLTPPKAPLTWMQWTVELYVPPEEEQSCCRVTATAILWIASMSLIVPLALFLFAALADCCTTPTAIKPQIQEPLPPIEDRKQLLLRALRKHTGERPGDGPNLICHYLNIQSNDDVLCDKVIQLYSLWKDRGDAHILSDEDFRQLDNWILGRPNPHSISLVDLILPIGQSLLATSAVKKDFLSMLFALGVPIKDMGPDAKNVICKNLHISSYESDEALCEAIAKVYNSRLEHPNWAVQETPYPAEAWANQQIGKKDPKARPISHYLSNDRAASRTSRYLEVLTILHDLATSPETL